jgi:hypothetical protein
VNRKTATDSDQNAVKSGKNASLRYNPRGQDAALFEWRKTGELRG